MATTDSTNGYRGEQKKNERKLNCITAAWLDVKIVLACGIQHEDLSELEMVFKKLSENLQLPKKRIYKKPVKINGWA